MILIISAKTIEHKYDQNEIKNQVQKEEKKI